MSRAPSGFWTPSTRVGQLVKEGKIGSIEEIFAQNLALLESEIVDTLLPSLKNEVLNVNLVQKQTDAGELSRFKVVVVVGNEDGYVGLGLGKAKQVRFAIDVALANAKLNVVPVRRGCGSWECACGNPHSVPFDVSGKAGSVEVVLLPAPKGVGIVAGDTAKVILRLAGIRDVWTRTFGETRSSLNFAEATFDAIRKIGSFKSLKG